MKRKLLFAIVALLCSVGTWAHQTPAADGVYYLYNEATGLFMSRGATWGTRALVDNYGAPIKLTASDTKFVFTAADRNVNGYGGQYWMYSDEGTAANRIIEIIAVSDGNYKLRNNLWGTADQYIYINAGGDAGFTNLLAANSGDQAGLAEGMYLWKFLSQAERDEVIAAKVEANSVALASKIGYTVSSTSELETLIGDADQFAATNMTSSISSASLESSISGWTYNKEANRNKDLASNANGTECFQGCGTLTQTVSGLKKGLYKVTINGFHRDGVNTACYSREHADGLKAVSFAYLDANGYRGQIKSWASDATSNTTPDNMGDAKSLFNDGKYLTTVYTYVGDDGKLNLTIGFPAFNESGWYIFDNVTLTYYSDAVSDDDATVILNQAADLEDDIMEASLLSTLTSAKTTFNGARTIANYNALGEAITNAQASIAAYANAKAYLDEAETILAGTNVYTATAYADYYTTPKAKYENRTLTTAEANALVKTSTGWHSVNTIDEILLSSWTIGGQQALNYDKALYINTWSVEGNTDGSEFLAPFFEYWGDDNQSLGANSLVATVAGLTPNTTYSFTIRARVRQTNNQTKIANGITMKVGSGDAVDISSGAIFGTGPFYIGNFSAVGQTDADGNLVCTITVAASSNISWLSFYNCKYTEGEDLSAYIADYEFAKTTATNASNNAAYGAVTGKERADLTAALTTYASVDETDKAALIAAKEALETATATFVNAAATYNAFAELNTTVAATLGVTLPTITTTTTAADLDVEGIIVAEYTAATTNYAQDFTNKLGEWTNAPGTNHDQSWDGTTGENADKYYDLFNSAARAMTQIVTLPAGDYAMIAKGRASVNGRLTLVVGEETVTFPHKSDTGRGIATDGTATFADDATYANNGSGRGWEYRVMTFTSDGSTPITLTFNWTTASSNWVGLDDIVLLANPAALDYSALQAAYGAVTVPTLGFMTGEYAPYNNATNLKNISAAKAMLDNQDALDQQAIADMTTAITGMTWTENSDEVNAFCGGDFTQYETIDGKDYPYGWNLYNPGNNNSRIMGGSEGTSNDGLSATTSGKALLLKFNATYGESEGYTMPLKAATLYKITFKHGRWAEGHPRVTDVVMTDPDGVSITLAPGFQAETNDCQSNSGIWYTYTGYFVSTKAGDYKFNLTKQGGNTQMQIAIADIDLRTASEMSLSDNTAYAEGTYPSVSLDRTFSSEKWNTLCVPFEFDKSNFAAVKVLSSVTANGENVNMTFVDAEETVAAGTPCLVKATNNGDGLSVENVALDPSTTAKTTTVGDATKVNYIGTFTQVDLTDANSNAWVVSNNSLYNVDSDVTVGAYRAYFTVETSGAQVKALNFNFGTATGIEAINGETVENGTIFNLAGQRVQKAQKGLYIVNGKKVLVK